eukprot:TRINITY_DN10619_c0_g1_i1.p2 TRINITY_DN10619_c0_g1~~TRINITY_DN10619_c0_g1_i1.p2  ORF type:complete len:132 (+),score=8.91 TRINITY_DN10619_c0_g1_i1:98-493(+)
MAGTSASSRHPPAACGRSARIGERPLRWGPGSWGVTLHGSGPKTDLTVQSVSWLTGGCPTRRTLLIPASQTLDVPSGFSAAAVRGLQAADADGNQWRFEWLQQDQALVRTFTPVAGDESVARLVIVTSAEP